MVGHEAEGNDKFLENLQDYMVLQQVAREFGLRMRGYRKQGNASVVETDEGPKEVRRLRHPLDEYRFACGAAEFLRGQGFSRLPRATWAPSGSPIVNVGGTNYIMHDWVPGVQADLGNLCQLTQAVEMLAWLHRCGQGFHPPEWPAVRDDWGSWPRRFAGRIEELYHLEDKARSEEEDRFAHHFLKHLDEFLSEAARALEELEASPYEAVIGGEREKGGLCHRDFTSKNLILRDDGAIYLTDFDDLTMESRLEDLGKLLVRQGGWDLERILFILHVYHGVSPLNRAEVGCLGAYLRFPHEFWAAANAHSAGKEADRHILKRLVEQLPAKRHLLDDLRQADLSFLAGASPLYSLGFANLPEVPAGKVWTIATWPSAEGVAAPETDWGWQALPDEPAAEMFTEPAHGDEEQGTVLEDAGTGADSVWPEATDASSQLEEAEPGQGLAQEAEPLPDAGIEATIDREPVGFLPLLAWRPFPEPLRRTVVNLSFHG